LDSKRKNDNRVKNETECEKRRFAKKKREEEVEEAF
jgi:hypothetical protein